MEHYNKKNRAGLYELMYKMEDHERADGDTLALKKQHISLFSDNGQVINYTNMLKSCVHDVMETTKVAPHLNDCNLIDIKLDSLSDKIETLQKHFGYKS